MNIEARDKSILIVYFTSKEPSKELTESVQTILEENNLTEREAREIVKRELAK